VVNEVLGEINEVRLTSANFASARNIQQFVKESINRAYSDMHDDEYKWPWLAESTPLDEYLGNTYLSTVAGTRWYLADSTSTELDEDFGHIDWDSFTLTEEGVSGKEAPYVVRDLDMVTLTEWKRRYAAIEERDKSDSKTYGVPSRVIRYPDGKRIGLSPIPDEEYRIYFYAWKQLTALVTYDDPLVIPSQYKPVLLARTRYHVWQFKGQDQRASYALQDYKKGLRRMREALNPLPDIFEDDRVIYV